MRSTQTMFETHARVRLAWIIAPAVFSLVMIGQAQQSFAQQLEPKTFSSPGAAAHALFEAVDGHDDQGVEAILGAGKDVTSTSDDEIDKLEREQFCRKYEQMHRLVAEPDGTTVLYIGAENWPFPIPLTSSNGKWFFDAKTGKQEMLFRRIGEDEAAAIEVCRALTTKETSKSTAGEGDDPIRQFAERADFSTNTGDGNEPFYGYYFRAVSAPAANTTAGTSSTMGSAKMAGRPAFVAYPAEYRLSGVMTFIVTEDGVVYEKDLGPETSKLAMDIQARKLPAGWRAVE